MKTSEKRRSNELTETARVGKHGGVWRGRGPNEFDPAGHPDPWLKPRRDFGARGDVQRRNRHRRFQPHGWLISRYAEHMCLLARQRHRAEPRCVPVRRLSTCPMSGRERP
jgi:hypothetical protein